MYLFIYFCFGLVACCMCFLCSSFMFVKLLSDRNMNDTFILKCYVKLMKC